MVQPIVKGAQDQSFSEKQCHSVTYRYIFSQHRLVDPMLYNSHLVVPGWRQLHLCKRWEIV